MSSKKRTRATYEAMNDTTPIVSVHKKRKLEIVTEKSKLIHSYIQTEINLDEQTLIPTAIEFVIEQYITYKPEFEEKIVKRCFFTYNNEPEIMHLSKYYFNTGDDHIATWKFQLDLSECDDELFPDMCIGLVNNFSDDPELFQQYTQLTTESFSFFNFKDYDKEPIDIVVKFDNEVNTAHIELSRTKITPRVLSIVQFPTPNPFILLHIKHIQLFFRAPPNSLKCIDFNVDFSK